MRGFSLVAAGLGGGFGETFTMVPTAFVRPSRNTIRVPGLRNSGCFMN